MGGWGRVSLGAFLLVFSSACATAGGTARLEGFTRGDEDVASLARVERGDRRESWRPTLLVENYSGEHIAVRVNGFRIGTAAGGRTCISIPQVIGPVAVEFAPLGSDPQTAWPVHLASSSHWRVELRPGNRLKYDVQWVRPAANGCER